MEAKNEAAASTKVIVICPGFSTHAMNMGQRFLQLNSTYTAADANGATLHVSQVPPNAAILAPGPAMLFVVVNGVPSVGVQVMVGNGQLGTQTTTTPVPTPTRMLYTTGETSCMASEPPP